MMKKPLVAFFIWTFLILTGFSAIAQTGPQLNYHGRIVDGITNLGVSGLRNFRIQVRTPAGLADNCLMYEETQSKNLVNGVFVINLNNGSGARADATAPVYTLQQIFSNKNPFGSFTFAGSRCVSTNPFTYTPTATDSRRVNIWFEDPIGAPGVWEPLPTQTVAYVPSAIESLNVGGFPIEALLRVVDGSGNPSVLPSPMSEAQYTNLMSLTSGSVVTSINGLSGAPSAVTGTTGTDFNITTSGSNINFNIPTASAANRGLLSTADWATFNAKMPNTGAAVSAALGYTPLAPANNLSDLSNAATARGNLGLGTSATMSVPGAAAAAATATEVVRGDDPRLTGAIVSGSAASGDLSGTYPNPTVATVGGRTAAQINQSVTDTLAATNSATVSTIVKRDASGNASFATAQATNFSGNNFYVFNTGNSNSIQIAAPTPLPSGDYILTLPDTAGTVGYVLATDGAGNTSWVDPSATSVTAVNANPPLSSSGGFTPTISIAQATGATSGYVTSSDWTTFNNKLSTTLSTGQVWVGSGANVAAAQFLNIGNIQSTVAGTWFNAGACAAGEILSYSPVSDQVTCTTMTLTGSQVATALSGIMSGDASISAGGTLTIANNAVTNAKINSVAWSKVTGTPTTYGGYGITDITLANAGNVNTVEAGLDAARGAFGTLGRVYFATDTREIWYDTGAAWLRVGSNAGLGGTVTSVAVNAPLSLSGVATVNPTISLPQATVAVDGYVSSTDFTTFSGKLDRAGDTMTGALNMGSNNITATGNIAMSANRNIQIGAYAADPACTAPDAGKVWYHTGSGALHYCDGTTVQSLGSLSGVVTGINGLTGSVNLVLGSAGTDASINTASPNVTLNLPTSSAANRGLLSSTDWSTFNAKQAGSTELTGVAALATTGFVQRTGAGTYTTVSSIDLTTSVTGVLPIANGGTGAATKNAALNNLLPTQTANANKFLQTDGTNTSWADISAVAVTSVTAAATANNPIVIAGTATAPTVDIPKSTAAVNGYLASADWSTFNSKQSSSLATGQVWVGSAGAVATAQFLNIGNIKSTVAGNWFNAGACASGEILTYSAVTDQVSCSAMTLTGSQVATALSGIMSGDATISAAGTLTIGNDKITAAMIAPNSVAWSTDVTGKPTTIAGYGITDAVLINAGGIATMEANVDASRGAAGTVGRVYVSRDTGEIWYDTGAIWVRVGSNAGLGGTVTNVTGTAPISVATGTSTPVVSMTKATAAVDGYLASADFTTFNNKLSSSLADGNIWVGNGANVPTAVVMSGDASISNTGSITLATVSTAGTYTKVTIDTKGRVTSATNINSADVTTALTYTPVNKAGDTMSGALNMGGQNITNTGVINMAANGNIQVSNRAADPAGLVAGDAGRTWFNTSTNELKYWNGTSVQTLGTLAGVVTGVNGLTGAVTLNTGTTGTDFNISTSSPNVTFNFPTSSAANRGLVSSTDWSLFNSKQAGSTELTGLAGLATTGFIQRTGAGTYSTVSSIDLSTSTTGTLALANGGTGATTAATARTNLGVGTGDSPSFTGLTVSGVTGNTLLRANGSGVVANATSADITTLLGFTPTSSALPVNQIFVGNASNVATAVSMSGDASIISDGTITLKNTGTAGTYGSASAIPSFTTDAQGRVTSVTTNAYQDATAVTKGVLQVGTNLQVAGGTISLQNATAAQTGALTSADWTTFNNKQGALGFTPLNAASNLSDVASADASRTNLGLGTASSPTFTGLTLSGLTNGFVKSTAGVLSGGNTIALSTDVTGVLPVANGGTGLAATGANGNVMYVAAGAFATATPDTAGLVDKSTAQTVAGVKTFTANPIIDNAGVIQFREATAGGTNYIGLKAPAAVAADVTFTLPIADGTVGQVLKTDGAGNLGWVSTATGTVTSVTSANTDIGVATTTTTPVLTLNSGLGANQIAKVGGSAISNNTVIVANGAGGLAGQALTDGQILIGATGAAPVAAVITGTANRVTVTNGAGTITLSGPQDIHSGASPTFTGLTLSAITGNTLLKANGSGVLANATSADVTTLLGFSPGTVTNVTGTAPINVATGTTTPVVSIAKSTAAVDGYLAATDFTIFAAKMSSDFSNVSGTLGIANGGTGGTTAATARTNLGVGTGDSPSFTGLTVSGVTGNTLLRANGSGVVANATSADITTLLGFTPASNTLAANMIFVGNGSNVATAVAMSGDASIVSNGTITLKNTGTAGTYGSASAVPSITTDAQGRVTNVTTNAYQDATGATKGIVQAGNNISVAAGVISVATADGSTTGVITSSDWTTFNSKMSATIAAPATSQYIRYNGTNWVNSLMVSSDITTSLGYTPLNPANNLSDVANAGTSRTNLGLGTGNSPTFTGMTLSGVAGNTLVKSSGAGVLSNATSADVTTLLGFTPGTVTSIIAGTGLTGGTITGTGTIGLGTELTGVNSLATTGFVQRTGAGAYSTVASIDLTTSVTGTLPVANGGTGTATIGAGNLVVGNGTGAVTSLAAGSSGNVVYATGASTWSSGTADTAGLVDKASAQTIAGAKTFGGNVKMSSPAALFQLQDNTTNTISMRAPAVVTSYTLTWPAAVGTAGQVLTTDATGILSWSSASSGTVTSVTSANADIGVATTTITPVLTLNSGLGANQIAKVGGSAISNNTVIVANGAGGLAGQALTDGQLLIGATGAAPVAAAITGTANRVTVTNGAGTITLSGPQDIHSGASPTFTGLTLSGVAGNTLVKSSGAGVLSNATSADVTTLLGFSPGTVTNVTGTAPISVATGTTTPVVSIAKSTAGVDGYLAATDFTIFAAKMSSDFSNASGTLGLGNGGTGATTAGTARTNLGVGTGDSPTFTGLTVSGVNGNTLVKSSGAGVLSNATSADITTLLGFTPSSATLATNMIFVGNGSNVATAVAMSGDASIVSSGTITLKNTGTAGTYGSASAVPSFTTDAQGRVTNVTTNAYQDATGATKGIVQVGNNISVAAGVISVATADGSTTGVITSSDWTTFNSKLSATIAAAASGQFIRYNGANWVNATLTSADVTAGLGFTPLNAANNLSDVASAATSRTNLGLGTGNSPTFTGMTLSGVAGNTLVKSSGAGVLSNATSADVTTLLGFTPGTVTSIIAGTGLTGGTITTSGTIGLGTELSGLNGLATTGFVQRTGAGAYSTVSSIDLTTSVTGALPVANGGTGATTAATARTNLGLGTGDSPTFTGLTVSGVNGNTIVKSNGSGVLSNATSADITTLLGFTPGSVTSVTSANTDIGIATTTTTPVLTLNSGLGANQIAKVGGVAISNNTVIVANGAGGLAGQALTDGQLLIGSTGAAPVAAAITGTANRVTVTNGAGTITLSGPQDIHSGASPTFTGMTLSGVSGNTLVKSSGAGVLSNATSADITTLLGFTPGQGTVTNVTGTAPVSVATGTSTPVISMARSTASVDGYLASTDFTTFAAKMSSDFSNASGTLGLANGGTGGTTAATARTSLGVGTGDSPSFTGLTVSGVNGNTLVKSSGAGVLSNATSADVTTLLGFTPGSVTSIIAGTGLTGGTITTSGTIGLGTELSGLNGLATTGFVQRTGAGAYSTVSSIDLTTSVTGALPIANGGTNATTANTALNNLLPAQSASSVLQSNGTNTSWLAFNTAASNNTLVQRDGSGVTQAYGVGISGATAGSVTFTAPGTVTTYSLQLPAAQGGAGTVLQNNGAGVLSWVSSTAASTDLTTSVTGILPVANGGTGLSSGTSGGIPYFSAAGTIASSAALTANGVMLGGGAGTTPTATAAGTANQVLRIPGGGGAPVFGSIDLSSTAAVTNSLAVGNGGTGASTLTSGSLVVGNGTSAVNFLTAGSTGNVIYATGAAAWASGTPTAAGLIAQGTNSFAATMNIGTGDANQLNIKTNGSTRMSFDTSGAVQVTGQAYSVVTTSSAATPLTWDANTSNTMRWSVNTSTITANIHNMKPGAAYQLVVSGSGTGTTTINCYSDAGTTALTQGFMPANGNRVAGTRNKTVYTLMSDGESCLVTWITGF